MNYFDKLLFAWSCLIAADVVAAGVDFTRDIQPLLSDRCFVCHGPDQEAREAELRLDLRAEATESVIIPGDSAGSELVERISATDPDLQMPPADSQRARLNQEQIALVRRWIDEGAHYDQHWSFRPLLRRAPPEFEQGEVRNAVDRFILPKLADKQLEPSRAADRRTLIRRLSFDLLGLPPTPEEVERFVAEPSARAYDRLVDRLLRSPHFGERMGMYWLDVVRYADTNGIHGDNFRPHSSYRDWVIKAFNDNLAYDQFVLEQLAGDLIPNSSFAQRIASGFNRLNMTTREGGAQPKEYQAIYQADRVRNTSAIFLGITMGCAQCHDHKFDPITMRDFYTWGAFFADLEETAVGVQKPISLRPVRHDPAATKLDDRIDALQQLVATPTAALDAAQVEWEKGLQKLPGGGSPEELGSQTGQADAQLTLQPDGSLQLAADKTPERDTYTNELQQSIARTLKMPPAERSAAQRAELSAYYRTIAPQLSESRAELARLLEQQKQRGGPRPVLVSSQLEKPRMVKVLSRGNWMDESGEVVQPGIPAVFGTLQTDGERATRLDLARWIVSPTNPLSARVQVNRLWKIVFGRGLARPLDDLGAQGRTPLHPELLDWLATEFVRSGWDTKKMLKLLVTSAAYRRSSIAAVGHRERDPENDYYARQNRFRLDAEMVRDNALAISGLLNRTLGGESAKPYQPAGYWAHLNFPAREYAHDLNANQYRRGLYTYWCRTFLHPSLVAFDAPSREECTVDRPRSNTPLAALVLLNDPTYVEAARVLADQIMQQAESPSARIEFAYQRVLQRKPRAEEAQLLTRLWETQFELYSADIEQARNIQGVGLAPRRDDHLAHRAAWTAVARALLNLHETIMRN